MCIAKILFQLTALAMIRGCGDHPQSKDGDFFALESAKLRKEVESVRVVNDFQDIEVAPGSWLRLEGELGRRWFQCSWKNKPLKWEGRIRYFPTRYFDIYTPKVLREWEGDLYLIFMDSDVRRAEPNDSCSDENGRPFLTKAADRSDDPIFYCCRSNSSLNRFEPIPRSDFPRAIATQNMELHLEPLTRGENGEMVDTLDVIRELDVTSPHFHNSTTARIWYFLEKGMNPHEIKDTPEQAKSFYLNYLEKYKPIALPNLTRESSRP